MISLSIARYDKLILNGDLNIHINKNNDSKALKLMYLLDGFELTQHINLGTFQQWSSQQC